MVEKPVADCYYNVHKQLIKRLQFLHNVEGYMKDSKKEGHAECEKMWGQIVKNEIENVALLKQAVKNDNSR